MEQSFRTLGFEVSMMWNLGIFFFVFPEKKKR